MKVFISWSGEPSRSIARALYGWLPLIVQQVEAWVSDEEIDSGRRWSAEVARALDETDFGIICVTAANQDRPWLMFEAGALAKRLDVARVVPLYVDIKPAQVVGPLAAFQGRILDRDGIMRLVQDISNAARDKPLAAEHVNALFEAMWPLLESRISEAKAANPVSLEPSRSITDMMEEVIQRLRRIDSAWLYRTDFGSDENPEALASLSDQERSVAELAAQGLSRTEISRELRLSPRTVAHYLMNIYDELGVRNNVQLLRVLQGDRAVETPRGGEP